MKCLECNCEMRPVQLTAGAYEVMAMIGVFKGGRLESVVCPKCGRLELRIKSPERLWKTEEK